MGPLGTDGADGAEGAPGTLGAPGPFGPEGPAGLFSFIGGSFAPQDSHTLLVILFSAPQLGHSRVFAGAFLDASISTEDGL